MRSYQVESRSSSIRNSRKRNDLPKGRSFVTVRMQRSVQHEKTFFLLSTAPSTRNPPFSVFCVHHGFRRMFYDVRTDALYRASVVSQEDGRNPRHTRDCSLDQISAQALSCRNCRSKQRFVNDRNTKTSRKGGLCVWLVR